MAFDEEPMDEDNPRICECGDEIEPGGCCHNPECRYGEANNEADRGDRLYHEQADREAEAFFERRGR